MSQKWAKIVAVFALIAITISIVWTAVLYIVWSKQAEREQELEKERLRQYIEQNISWTGKTSTWTTSTWNTIQTSTWSTNSWNTAESSTTKTN